MAFFVLVDRFLDELFLVEVDTLVGLPVGLPVGGLVVGGADVLDGAEDDDDTTDDDGLALALAAGANSGAASPDVESEICWKTCCMIDVTAETPPSLVLRSGTLARTVASEGGFVCELIERFLASAPPRSTPEHGTPSATSTARTVRTKST